MGEDSVDEVGGVDAGVGSVNARDDAQRPTTHRTVLDVDMEDSLAPLHPVRGGQVRRRIIEEAVPDLARAGLGRLDDVLADAVRERLRATMRQAFAEHGIRGAGIDPPSRAEEAA